MADLNRRRQAAARDRALRAVWLATAGGIGGALGLSAIFSVAAEATFSGKTAAQHQAPPRLPDQTAPVQRQPPPPIVVENVIRHPYAGRYGGTVPSGPSSGPVPLGGGAPLAGAPAPPPPPCVSTPSHPC
jgi:hypothetical protein